MVPAQATSLLSTLTACAEDSHSGRREAIDIAYMSEGLRTVGVLEPSTLLVSSLFHMRTRLPSLAFIAFL